AASYASAFAHLALGDLDACDRDVAASRAAARLAHDPLRAIRARLLAAEAERRRNKPGAAVRVLQRITALHALPPIVSARVALLKDLTADDMVAADAVAKQIASTGLRALALFAPRPDPKTPVGPIDAAIDQVLEILHLCQTAGEERGVLVEVCRRLRSQ